MLDHKCNPPDPPFVSQILFSLLVKTQGDFRKEGKYEQVEVHVVLLVLSASSTVATGTPLRVRDTTTYYSCVLYCVTCFCVLCVFETAELLPSSILTLPGSLGPC